MADDLQRSLDGMSLQPPQQQAHSQAQRQGSFSSGGSGLPSPSQPPQSVHAPPGYGSMHSVSSNNHGSGGESASARFERFFSSGNASSPGEGGPASHHQFGHQAASIGPGSSAAGLASNGAFGSFGHAFGGSTGSAGGSAFGGTGPGLRSKSSGIRGGLPSQWGAVSDTFSATSPTTTPAFLGSNSQAGSGFLNQGQGAATGILDDDIIPTAIVVKNIPFSIKREQLLQIIEDLQIPMPYAFNYHFDQGVFRGLAFANFRSGEEADAVVAALNGFDVSGRKLRVEYKKVLQAGEKERIEKEKAIKRMQSMQMEKERERVRRHQLDGSDYGQPPMPGHQHDPLMMQSYGNDPSIFSTSNVDPPAASHAPLTADTLRVVDQQNGVDLGTTSDRSAAGASSKKEELDLNDPATLEIYSRVLLFKDDRMRDELSFSKSLSPMERRTVHLVAQKLGLYHYSMGEGDERYVIVTKNEVQNQHKTLRSQASTIGRSNRGDMTGGSVQNGLLAPGSSLTTGRSGLRSKKSAPDMKRPRDREGDGSLASAFVFGSGANQGSQTGYNNGLLAPGGNAGMTRKSNGNLREGYSATMGRRPQAGGIGGAAGLQSLFSSPFDVPPVPSLPSSALNGNGITYGDSSPSPSGLNSNNGSLSAATSQHVLRQPAGPNATSRGFAQRARIPLHQGQSGESPSREQQPTPTSSSSVYDSRSNDDQQQQPRYYDNHEHLADADVRTHSPLEV